MASQIVHFLNLKRRELFIVFVVIMTIISFYCIDFFFVARNNIDLVYATSRVRKIFHQYQVVYRVSLVLVSILLTWIARNYTLIIKILGIYVFYSYLSNLIETFLNINNPEYIATSWWNRIFYQDSFWNLLVEMFPYVIFTALLMGIFAFHPKAYVLSWRSKILENIFVTNIAVFLIVTDSKFFPAITNIPLFVKSENAVKLVFNMQHWGYLADVFPLLFGISLVVLYFCSQGLSDLLYLRSSFSLSFLSSAIFSIYFATTIQYSFGKSEAFRGVSLVSGAVPFQILSLFFIFLLLYTIINRFLLSTSIIVLSGVIFTIANALKLQLRNEPILPSDLVWLKTPRVLLSFVEGISFWQIIGLVVVILLLNFFLNRLIFRGKIYKNLFSRITVLSLILSTINNVNSILVNKEDNKVSSDIPILTSLFNVDDYSWLGNTINARYRSLSAVWAEQLTTEVMNRPKGYNQERMKQLTEKYKKLSNSMNAQRPNNISDQTVIYVLSESFADPSRIEGVQLSQDPIPYIRDLKTRVTGGLMKSDGYGGGTANMEFQTLTGLPYYNLNPTVSILYSEVAPQMSPFVSISNVFNPKNREVIHYQSKINYSRDVIYDRLGFEKFINYDDIKKYNAQPLTHHISDESTYNTVLKELNPKESQFFSVITMQNHSPYTGVEQNDFKATGPGFSDEENLYLSNYSKLINVTDNATKSFLESLSKIDKKITVVFYGDHLPGLYPASAFENHPESQYLTDYFIWSNFDAPKLDYPVVNSSDFAAMLFEQTDSRVSPYYALLTEVLHKANVGIQDLDEEGKIIAEDLRLVEYDIISGQGYLKDSFFVLPK